ncbi:hypothetical protein AN958_06956 [Leucoagaricus sp. SymC.cos]|nr:hypothetical protein AN958_06956 [Leucoagaricus sp. SymC.cos]
MPIRSKTEGLSAALLTVELPPEPPEPPEPITEPLEDCRYIGSYNWSPDSTRTNPSIIVPGSPNVWSDPDLPFQLQPDEGRQVRDSNNYMLPGQPFLPLLAAVSTQQIFLREDWKTIDFITDRIGLRHLLRWIGGAGGKGFRIDTQLVGTKTVVFNRWEPVDTELMHGNMYSLNFQRAVTKPMPPSTERSSWHHRVVTYKFGQFRMVVQFEVDACLPQEHWQSASSSSEGELVRAMSNLGLSPQDQNGKPEMFGLKLHHEGRADIPHSAIIELATKSSAGIGWSDRYPQLYFSQTGNHHMGNRRNNNFIRIDKYTRSSPELLAVHERLQPTFKRLEQALRRIQSIAMEHGKDERLSLVYEKRNLTVHRNLTSQSCLLSEALGLFD